MVRTHDREAERVASLYDTRLALYARQTIEEALRIADLSGNEAVLDACCGTGELIQQLILREHRGPVVGVDYSAAVLNVARRNLRNHPGVILQHGDIQEIDLPTAYYHVVFNTNALHYLPEPLTALREVRRVLRPHGRLILVDLVTNSHFMQFWAQLRRLVGNDYHMIYHTEEMAKLLRQAGFSIMRRKLWRVNLFWSVMLIEAQNPFGKTR